MTVYAYRDGVLAADTRACGSGGQFMGRVIKIAKRGPILAAAAGQVCFARAGLDWFRAGMVGKPPLGDKDANADMDLFIPGGFIISLSPFGGHTTLAPYYANGSGGEVALGAMFMGADAPTAVRAAMAHDSRSGGEITVLRHGE